MNYISTRDKSVKVTAAKAIAQGISIEGGLFVPDTFPTLTADDFKRLSQMDYKGRAKYILKAFFQWLYEEEYVDKNIMNKIKTPKIPKRLREGLIQ